MSAPSGYPVEGAGCDCVWVGNGALYSACAAHDAWSNRERKSAANDAFETAAKWHDLKENAMRSVAAKAQRGYPAQSADKFTERANWHRDAAAVMREAKERKI